MLGSAGVERVAGKRIFPSGDFEPVQIGRNGHPAPHSTKTAVTAPGRGDAFWQCHLELNSAAVAGGVVFFHGLALSIRRVLLG